MSWLKLVLIGLGIVVALAVIMVITVGKWSSGDRVVETMSMTVGDRTITVSGHYKEMTQETTADGIKIIVDKHVIAATPGELIIDDKPQAFDPSQDIEIFVKEDGGLEAKPAQGAATSGKASE